MDRVSAELRAVVAALVRDWAAAHVRAPISPAALQAQVDSLLYQHERRGLSPRGRARLFGGRIRTVRGARQVTGHESEAPDADTGDLSLEHGLLSLDLAALIADPSGAAARVWVQSDVGSYYAGAGTLVPDSDPERYRHSAGRLVSDVGLVPPTDWPDDAPTVSGGAHDSVHGAGVANLSHLVQPNPSGGGYHRAGVRPESYTGPARAWMQACLGAGMTAADVGRRLPDGWSTHPGVLGLTRAPDHGDWWALQASAGGLLAVRMVPWDAAAGVVQGWVDDESITGTGAALAAVYPLASLHAADAPVTLIGAEQMAACWSGQGESSGGDLTIWVEDALPAGAYQAKMAYDTWSWVSTPTPPSGSVCHASTYVAGGSARHGFAGAADGPTLGVGDVIEQYVYLDPTQAPSGVALELLTGALAWNGDMNYCAYWGDLPFHVAGRPEVRMGDRPPTGQWVLLQVPVSALGLVGKGLAGAAYAVKSGRAWWDRTARRTPTWTYAQVSALPLGLGGAWSSSGTRWGIVCHRAVSQGTPHQAREAARSTATLTWSDGAPSATLSVGAWSRGRIRHDWYRLWYGDQTALSLLMDAPVWPGDSDCAASIPVLTWWDGEDPKTLRYYRTSTGTAGTAWNTVWSPACSAGGYAMTYGAATAVASGGYSMGDTPPSALVGTITYTQQEGMIVPGDEGPEQVAVAYGPYLGDTACSDSTASWSGEITAIVAGMSGWAYHGYTVRARARSATTTGISETGTITGGGIGQIGVYLSGAPDALWLVAQRTRQSTSGTRSTYTYATTYSLRAHLQLHFSRDGVSQYVDSSEKHGAFVLSQSAFFSSSATITSEQVSTGATTDTTGECRIGGDTYAISGGSWGGQLAGDGSTPASTDLYALPSASGATAYRPHPGADAVIVGWSGSPPPLSSPDTLAWVGHI